MATRLPHLIIQTAAIRCNLMNIRGIIYGQGRSFDPDNTLIFSHDAKVAAWVARRLPHVGNAGLNCAGQSAVLAADKADAGIVYHDCGPVHGVCQISASQHVTVLGSRGPSWTCWRCPFLQYRCRRVTDLHSVDNARAIRFNYGSAWCGRRCCATTSATSGPRMGIWRDG